MSFSSDISQGLITTTDETITLIATYSFDNNALTNTSAIAKIRVVGMDAAQNTICIEMNYGVKRETGDCLLVGSPSTPLANSDLALSSASAGLVANGPTIELHVGGVADTTINWGGRIDLLYLTQD